MSERQARRQDFSETTTPATIEPHPRLFLIARDFEGRTRSALDFLRENRVPVSLVPVALYVDPSGRRIVDVEGDHEPPIATAPPATDAAEMRVYAVDGRRVTVADLIDAGLLEPDEDVEFVRPRLGELYKATILDDGIFRLPDGSIHQSPSLAAMRSADLTAYDGWHAWRVVRLGGTKLHELRERYITAAATADEDPADDATPGQPSSF